MFNIILITILRSTIAFFMLIIITRLMGRKLLSEMTFFEFGMAITIGSVAGLMTVIPEETFVSASFALITFTFLTILTGYLNIKSFRIRKLANSEPIVLISNGKIVEENMKKERVTLNKLMMHLRQKDIFNIADVEFAVMEIDGKVSVLPKSQKKALTPSDLKIPTKYIGLTKDLIMDGEIMHENLEDAGLNQMWLTKELKEAGIENEKDVFYAGIDTQGSLYVSRKSDGQEKHGQYGIE